MSLITAAYKGLNAKLSTNYSQTSLVLAHARWFWEFSMNIQIKTKLKIYKIKFYVMEYITMKKYSQMHQQTD